MTTWAWIGLLSAVMLLREVYDAGRKRHYWWGTMFAFLAYGTLLYVGGKIPPTW